MDKNLACGPFFRRVAADSHHIACSPLCQRAARSCKWPFQSTRQLEHRAKVTEAVGGAEGGDGRWGKLSSCNLGPLPFLPCHHFCRLQRLFVSKNSTLRFPNTSSCETTQLVSQDASDQAHHGAGPDVVRGNKGAGVVRCQGIPQSKAGLGVNGFKKFPIVL